ncbi:MAG: glycine zipper 2TM domain-containing protein [Comamonadaceae bacterium]|nr:MAG: glycine zipper 2TM domain-containing protein [Comamonadaceae bacterium]
MKKVLLLSTAASAAFLALPASATDILARVVSSTPVVQQVAVPRQVCSNQQVLTQAPRSGAGALLGAVAGGAAGNAIGNGGGRALATMIGLVGGAMVGDRVEGSNDQIQNVQNCTTQTYYENRPSHYNVVYEYQGTQYSTQMANDPGGFVRLQVSPVGGMNQQPPAPTAYVQPAPVQQPVYVQPGFVQQPTYIQQGYSPVVAAPVVYQSAPVYYQRPYYAPSFYPPVGLSLNFGYSRGGYGYGGGHRGHWR